LFEEFFVIGKQENENFFDSRMILKNRFKFLRLGLWEKLKIRHRKDIKENMRRNVGWKYHSLLNRYSIDGTKLIINKKRVLIIHKMVIMIR